MRSPSPWTVLGLKGPVDRSEVRRAYARRLKQVSPEDDPKGFEQLRKAYETALAVAGTARPEEPEPATAPESAASDRPEPAAEPRSGGDAEILPPAARAARDRLESLIAGPGAADVSALKAALDDLLAPSALEAISARADAELWVAGLIIANMPRSDRLLDEAYGRFHWNASDRGRDVAPAVLRSIGRRGDLAARDEMLRREHPQHKVFAALASSSGRRLRLRGLFAPHLASDVRELLRTIRTRHPSLVRDLNPASLAWWDDYLATHRASPLAVWALILVTVAAAGGSAAALGAPAVERLLACLGALALCLGLAALEQSAAAWLRRSWTSGGPGETSAWSRLGWAPASAALLLVAPTLPPGPLATALVASGAAACLWWLVVTSDGTRRPARDHLVDWLNAVRQTLYGLPFLLFTWSLFVCRLSHTPLVSAMAAAVTGGFIVAIRGETALTEFWSAARLGPARWPLATALGVLSLVAATVLAASIFEPRLWPLSIGLVAVPVLAAKTPLDLTNWPPGAIYRGLLAAAGALSIPPGLALLLEGSALMREDIVATVTRLIGGLLLVGPLMMAAEMLRGGVRPAPGHA